MNALFPSLPVYLARIALVIALCSLCAPRSVAQDHIILNIGKDTFGYHLPLELVGKSVPAHLPENEHWAFFVEDILDEFGRKRDILVLESEIRNALAMVKPDGNGLKMIVMDPQYQHAGHLGGIAYRFVLAHEIGHHVCGHVYGDKAGLAWEKELEADRFAGAAMQRWLSHAGGYGLKDLLEAISRFLPAEGSETHPPLKDRIAAATAG